MCGLFGYLTHRPIDADRIDLREATRSLEHRGPDDAGTFSGSVGDLRCQLAHTRLAIIDPSDAGHQPMQSADGRYVVVHNGEIENHSEVRRELEREGPRFRSASDTEVVVEAFARWGPASLDRLRGMFAFAIWDRRLGDLFVARDRLGIKPLYFTMSGATDIAFASEIRTLLRAGAAAPRLSMPGVMGYLRWGSVPEPHTILERVQALPAGSYLTFRGGRASSTRYWRPRSTSTRKTTFTEAAECIAPLLKEAVSSSLVSDVPVGIFLSGGIDSSVIAALASAEKTEPLDTFTVAFDPNDLGESRHAASVAAAFGCRHHEVRLEPTRIGHDIDEAIAAFDQPSADGPNTFIVAKAVRAAGISVALSGLGADEIFAGYDHFRHFDTARRVAGIVPRRAASLLESLIARPSLRALPRQSQKLVGLLGARRDPMSTYAALRCMFTPMQVEKLVTARWKQSEEEPDSCGESTNHSSTDPVTLYSVLELDGYVKNTLLRDTDAMSMAHGLEVRVPYLDHRLVELLLSIPGQLKVGHGGNKSLLVASAPPLPNQVPTRPKTGFTLPWEHWLRGAERSRFEALLSPARVAKLTFLDAKRVDSLWRAFTSHDHRVTASRVWCLGALVAWCERNKVTM